MTDAADGARVRRVGLLLVLVVVVAIVAAALALRGCDDADEPRTPRDTETPAVVDADQPGRDGRTRRRVDSVDAASQETSSADDATSPAPVAASERRDELSPSWQELDLARHEIEGRVVTPDGAPVADVTVTLVSTWLDAATREALLRRDAHSRHLASSMTTGADGTFRLEYVEGGERALVVGALARPDVVAEVDPGAFHELVVPTEPRRLTVTVLHVDGTPAGNVSVWVSADLPWSESPLSSQLVLANAGTTNERGAVTLHNVTVGTVQLCAHRVGKSIMPQIAGTASADVPAAGDAAATLRLGRDVPVRIVVLDDASGEPLSDAIAYDRSRWVGSDYSDAEGRLELPMPLQPHVAEAVFVDHQHYAGRSVFALIDGDPTAETVCEIEARLQRAASVALRCVDTDGAPLRHVTVIVRSAYVAAERPIRTIDVDTQAAQTGTDGRIELGGLHPGGGLPLQIILMRAGVVVLDREFPSLQAGETRDLGEVVVAAGRTLTGRVLSPDGKPFAGAVVIAVPRRPDADEDSWRPGLAGIALTGQGRRSETGNDGRFAIGGIAPGLVDVLVVEPRPGLLKEGVSVTSGSDPAPLELRLPRSITIRGRVVRADGAPAAGVTIIFPIPGPVDLNAIQDTTTDADGRFALPGFAATAPPFDVRVLDDAGHATTFRVDAAEGEATLRLE